MRVVQYDTLVAVLRRIVGAEDLSDKSLNVMIDDACSPPSSVHKSKVIKRTEKMGAALVHDWQPRFSTCEPRWGHASSACC